MKVSLGAVPYERRDTGLGFVPDPKIVISGAREIEIVKADRLRSGRFTA